jgi:hypothetical protein
MLVGNAPGGRAVFPHLLVARKNRVPRARAAMARMAGIGVPFVVVTGAVEVMGWVAGEVLGSPPVTMVVEEVSVGVSGTVEGKTRRMTTLSMSPSAAALGFSKSPMVEM